MLGKNFLSPFRRHFSGLVSPDQVAPLSRSGPRCTRFQIDRRYDIPPTAQRCVLRFTRLQIRPDPFGAMNRF
jgi:hypothetical protein